MRIFFYIARKTLFTLFVLLVAFLIVRGVYLSPKVRFESITQHSFSYPTHVIQSRQHPDLYFVTEKQGKVMWFKENSLLSGTTIDISDRVYSSGWEEGLLSIVKDPAHPQYAYLFYSMDKPKKSRISRFSFDDSGLVLDANSELVIIEIPKLDDHHNGGMLAFGTDGYLYASIGDSYHTENLRAKKNLRGTIIRIDVSNAQPTAPYATPADNPFVTLDNARKEIYAEGFRNPWRFTFDSETGALYAADVGDMSREEISIVDKGGDYGWPLMEGELCRVEQSQCDQQQTTLPIASFPRNDLRSITGGYVYRGTLLPQYYGKYIFADYLRGLYLLDPEQPHNKPIASPDTILLYKMPTRHGLKKGETIHIVSFHQEISGELLIVNLQGTIERILPSGLGDWLIGFFWAFASFR